MKVVAILILVPLVVSFGLGSNVQDLENVTPVQKVIQLLDGMLEKAHKEMKDEEILYEDFIQFCTDTTAEKERLIDNADARINKLTAEIGEHTVESKRLKHAVTEHDEDTDYWKQDQEAATSVRKMDKADNDAEHRDYSESVDALTRAIATLKTQESPTSQVSLAQVGSLSHNMLIPESAREAIDAFVQEANGLDDDGDSVGLGVSAPDAHGYEFHSKSIMDMLEKLQGEFEQKVKDVEKKESDNQQAFTLYMQRKDDEIAHSIADSARKSKEAAAHDENRAKKEADKKITSETMESDIKYKDDLEATRTAKEAAMKERTKLRLEEIAAVEEAKEIIQTDDVSKNAATHLPNLIQTIKGTALAQLRANARSISQSRAASYLRNRGSEIKSNILLSLSVRVNDDPFTKVKKLIQDLITKLMEEANEEAKHKGWCDTELGTNKNERTKFTDEVAGLNAQIEELAASNLQLTNDIATLTDDLANLAANLKEATEQRRVEKENNDDTVTDAQDAQAAVGRALAVLNRFYEKAKTAQSFIQHPEIPKIFPAPYRGMQAENGGVIGMIEVIQSDFARLEADTKAAEAEAVEEFRQFAEDTNVDQSQKETDRQHKETTLGHQKSSLNTANTDLVETMKRLDTANQYYDKLKPACVDAGVSYEERVKRRQEEIESLEEALEILKQGDA